MTYIPDLIRRKVTERAEERCEYCLLHEQYSIYSHEVDHIIPENTVDKQLTLIFVTLVWIVIVIKEVILHHLIQIQV